MNCKRISVFFGSLAFCLVIADFAVAECSGKHCNMQRESKGMWYGDANMIGPINRQGFVRKPYSQWFVPAYEMYTPDRQVLAKLGNIYRSVADKLEIIVFMGTWCGDSQLQTPHLYKILDAIDFNYKHLNIIAVGVVPDEFRRSHDGRAEEGLNIYRVPTIIVKNGSQELGRIVETPLTTLEQDLLSIFAQQTYKPTAHVLEGEVNYYLQEYGVEGFEDRLDVLAEEFSGKGISKHELDHYIGFNLLYAKRYREAIVVSKMLLTLYPEAAQLHLAQAKAYDYLGETEAAVNSYRLAFRYLNEKAELDVIRHALGRAESFN